MHHRPPGGALAQATRRYLAQPRAPGKLLQISDLAKSIAPGVRTRQKIVNLLCGWT
jgi:hypothetical protein